MKQWIGQTDAPLDTIPIPAVHRHLHFRKVAMDGIAGSSGLNGLNGLNDRPHSHSAPRMTWLAALTGYLAEFPMLKQLWIVEPIAIYCWAALVGTRINAADS
jgi:hypothetical protein